MRLFDIILLAECDIGVYITTEDMSDEHLFTITNAQQALHMFSRQILDKPIKKITSFAYNQINVYI